MKRMFLLAAVLLTGVVSAAPSLTKEIDSVCKDLLKRRPKLSFAQIADELEKMRAEPRFATNAQCRAFIDGKIVTGCRRPNWTDLDRWNLAFERRIPEVAHRALADGETSYESRVKQAAWLSEYLAGEKKWDEAERVLESMAADTGKHQPKDEARLQLAFSDLYRWQDRLPEAWRALEKAAEGDPREAADRAFRLADDCGDEARAEAIAEKVTDIFARLGAYAKRNRRHEKARALARAFVADGKNRPDQRLSVATDWFAEEKTDEARTAFESLADIDRTKLAVRYETLAAIGRMFRAGDWEGVIRLSEVCRGSKGIEQAGALRNLAVAYGAVGRRKDARSTVTRALAQTKLKPEEKADFEALAALLSDGDVEKTLAASGLERKELAKLTALVAAQALAMGQNDVAERLDALRARNFVDFGQREMRVAFSKDSIDSVEDWRKIRKQLDRQLCDRKFGADLDALVTDVATGRESVERTVMDSKDAMVEVSAACDVKGLHLFLCVEDPNARLVESGFAGGVGSELYFAPGKYEPYTCFSANPRTGLNGGFKTKYDTRDYRRVERRSERRPWGVRDETVFSDKDYVLHLIVPWESCYQHVPKDGTRWRFECIAFCPSGPYTLGGSEGVHNSSKFCDLVFRLDGADVVAIRRAMLYRNAKGWGKMGRLDRFDKWADPEIGDLEFYEEVLKPLETELKGYAKMVTPEMTDDEVNLVFERALPRWIGLSHEIDALRRDWLRNRCCK